MHSLLSSIRKIKLNFKALLIFLSVVAVLLSVFGCNLLKKSIVSKEILNNRSEIVDRNGITLVTNKLVYDIYARRGYLNRNIDELMKEFSFLGIPENELHKKLNNKDYSYSNVIGLAKGIEPEKAEELIKKAKDLKIKEMDFIKRLERVYPNGNLASHVLGYVNFEGNVYAGIENTGFDKNGKAITGEKLQLTIDSKLQKEMEEILQKKVDESGAKKGTTIVINPQNGEILAFAVVPSYNPEKHNDYGPIIWKNWAITDVYPVGSLMKPITVASALEEEVITKVSKILDDGKINIQGWDIKNYGNEKSNGIVDLNYLVNKNSNVGIAKVALKMEPEKQYGMLKKFGFGEKTGIELPAESKGILSQVENWEEINQATIGYGYGIAVTSLQMASAYAAIANNGVWVQPHIIRKNAEDLTKRLVISEENAKFITEILSMEVEGKDYKVASKSGNSMKPNPRGGYIDEIVSSYVQYYPADNPERVVLTVLDGPNNKGEKEISK